MILKKWRFNHLHDINSDNDNWRITRLEIVIFFLDDFYEFYLGKLVLIYELCARLNTFWNGIIESRRYNIIHRNTNIICT